MTFKNLKDSAAFGIGLIVGAVGLLLIGVSVIVVASIVHGFVLQQLWSWFIVPFDFPELGIAHAIGISGLIRYLTYQPFLKTQKVDWKQHLAFAVAYPSFILLFGYIVHLCM